MTDRLMYEFNLTGIMGKRCLEDFKFMDVIYGKIKSFNRKCKLIFSEQKYILKLTSTIYNCLSRSKIKKILIPILM